MNDYLQIANSSIFYICGAIILLVIGLQAIVYIRMAFKEGEKVGLSKAKMLKALRASMISSIIPTIPIVVALIAMVPVLGIPIPWIRLSVIGSAPYELLAAGIGAKSMGINGLGGTGYTKEVFANSVWIMCFGSIWSVSVVIFFLKKLKAGYSKAVDKDKHWKTLLTNAAFLGVMSIFIADPVTTGGIPLVTLISGGILMTFFGFLIFKLKFNWLREFALTFSMLGAMLCSVVFSQLFL